jgi:hypothetical protein
MDVTADEFNKTVIRTEDSIRITFDVRPFGDRQGEAVDFYLHEVGMQINYGTFSTSKPIFVLYSRGTILPMTTHTWLKNLLARGVPVNLQEADS